MSICIALYSASKISFTRTLYIVTAQGHSLAGYGVYQYSEKMAEWPKRRTVK